MKNTKFLVYAAVIAAAYATLTLALSPIAFGSIQLRVSEALTVLAYFSPAAVAGLTLGCAISNLWSPFGIIDVIFGSLATLIAALITYKMPKTSFWRFLAPLPSVITNAIIIGLVITFSASPAKEAFFPLFLTNALSIGVPQLLICYIGGLPLLLWLDSSGTANRLLKK